MPGKDDEREIGPITRIGQEFLEISPTFFRFFAKLPLIFQRSIKLIIPFLILLLLTLLPLPLDVQIKYALAIFFCVSMLWTFGALPLPVTALLVPVLLTFYGILPTAEALIPFADPVVYLLMGGLIMAEAFRKHGIDRRLAYSIMMRYGGNTSKTLLTIMVVSALLSMWISNTATVALLIPVVLGIASRVSEEKRKLSVQLMLGVGIGAAIGGMATITGSSPNAVASGLLAREITWTFIDWMKVGLPISIILLLVSWQILTRIFRVESFRLDLDILDKDLKGLGPLSFGEKKTLIIFFPTVALWIAGADIGAVFGFPPSFMSAAIVALSSAFLLFATRTLEWQDARSISWEIFLIIGAGLALGEGLQASGAAEWMADQLVLLFGSIHIVLMMLIISMIAVALSNLMSNTATAAILVPILIGVSISMGVDPKLLVLVCALSVSISFITPIGTPPFTLIFSTGVVSRKNLAKGGFWISFPAVIIITIMVYLIVKLGLV